MTDLSFLNVSSKTASYYFKLEIKNPVDNTIYKIWTTDKSSIVFKEDAVGDFSSIVGSAALEPAPSNISSILTVSFPRKLILCRQIQGWPVVIYVVITSTINIETNQHKVLEGVIGKIDLSGNSCSVEVVSKYESLKQPSRYKLSTSCTREFGDAKCGVDRQTVIRNVLSMTGYDLVLDASLTLSAIHSYEVSIGDDNFILVSYNNLTNTITLDRKPLGKPDVVIVRLSCDRKLTTCKSYNNNAKFLGVIGLPANSLSLRL